MFITVRGKRDCACSCLSVSVSVTLLSGEERDQMIVNCVRATPIAVAVPNSHSHSHRASSYSYSLRPIMCCASSTTVNTEQLRSQLDQLHAEAHTARTKGTPSLPFSLYPHINCFIFLFDFHCC